VVAASLTNQHVLLGQLRPALLLLLLLVLWLQ
jgi:hypothetical protein